MAAERIPMRKVLDILRLAYEGGRSQREIGVSLALSQSTVSLCLSRFRASGLPWPVPADCDEAALDRRLFAVHGHAPTRKNTVTLGARSAATVRHALGWLSRMVATRMVVT